ncbi:MAG: energy transducer TonB [Opitutaceae bacterium]
MYCHQAHERWKTLSATIVAFGIVTAFFAILPFVNRINIRRNIQPGGGLSAMAIAPPRPIETKAALASGSVAAAPAAVPTLIAARAGQKRVEVHARLSEIPRLEPARLENEAQRAFVFDASDLDFTPMPVHRVPPEYPFVLKQQGIEGRALVEFRVDREGRVSDVRVLEASHPEFGLSVSKAVARWRFVPGMVGGDTVRFRMRLPVNFRLVETFARPERIAMAVRSGKQPQRPD